MPTREKVMKVCLSLECMRVVNVTDDEVVCPKCNSISLKELSI